MPNSRTNTYWGQQHTRSAVPVQYLTAPLPHQLHLTLSSREHSTSPGCSTGRPLGVSRAGASLMAAA